MTPLIRKIAGVVLLTLGLVGALMLLHEPARFWKAPKARPPEAEESRTNRRALISTVEKSHCDTQAARRRSVSATATRKRSSESAMESTATELAEADTKTTSSFRDDWKITTTTASAVDDPDSTGSKVYFNLLVVNEEDVPVALAEVKMTGLRTKGEMVSWYRWIGETSTAVTNSDGLAHLFYPRFVLERLEAGAVTFEVSHPDYTLLRDDLKIDNLKKVVLKRGASLTVYGYLKDESAPIMKDLVVETTFDSGITTASWTEQDDGSLITRKIKAGEHFLFAHWTSDKVEKHFSPMEKIELKQGEQRVLKLLLSRGFEVLGRLSPNVTRPVLDGVVDAHMKVPREESIIACSMYGTSIVYINRDGTFRLPAMPPGTVQITAHCKDWVNVNGQGEKSNIGHSTPQTFELIRDRQEYELPMEPTATLIGTVLDRETSAPVMGARVQFYPNTCSNGCCSMFVRRSGSEEFPFAGISDAAGLVVVPDLLSGKHSFGLSHETYALSPTPTPWGDLRRDMSIELLPGEAVELIIPVEKKDVNILKSAPKK